MGHTAYPSATRGMLYRRGLTLCKHMLEGHQHVHRKALLSHSSSVRSSFGGLSSPRFPHMLCELGRLRVSAWLQKRLMSMSLSTGIASAQEEVAVAGRVMARRFLGKLAFLSLVDDSGGIPIYLDRAAVDGASGEDAFK